MSMFHVGMRVVCVDDKMLRSPLCGLTKGRIYTVRRIDQCLFFHTEPNTILGLWLEEIIRDCPGFPDYAFPAWRFRPVHTTDISIFTAMLVPTPKEKVGA